MMAIKVLIADDQQLVRSGFRRILEPEPDIAVVGEAADGAEVIDAVPRVRPDIVLMDLQMPKIDGVEATRRLTAAEVRPRVHVIVITSFASDREVYEALHAGASGFLVKNASPDDLVSAIRVVSQGEGLLCPQVTRKVIEDFVRRPSRADFSAELDRLSEREIEVLRLMARGLSNAEIADALVLGETTVKTHVRHILTKLGLRDRVQAVVLAYESGLVQPGADGELRAQRLSDGA